jgi:DNA-binding response OmpR family regulator
MLQQICHYLEKGSMNHFAKLLLVEDDFDLADNLVVFLENRGFSVVHAPNGALALNELLDDAFDAILLDINLPGLDGLSLCERLRKDMEDQTPVLMLTAADTLEDRLKGFAVGTDDYVVKPEWP